MATSSRGGFVWPPQGAHRRGTRLADRYVLDGTEIGRGGSAVVLRAEDRKHPGRIVAVKSFAHEVELGALELEATLPWRIPDADDWLVRATDWGEDDGHAWIVMPFMSGGSLRDLIKRAKPGDRLWVARAMRAMVDVAAGLDLVHEADLVHRDVKPANSLFDQDGRAKLADFGIARAIFEAGLTPHGVIQGSPPYLPPEVAEGGRYTKAGDRYAHGVTLYEALVGSHPYPHVGPGDPIPKVTDWTPASRANPALPEEVDDVLLTAVDPDPARRWDSAGDVLRVLLPHLPLSDADREEMFERLAAGRRAADQVHIAERAREKNEAQTVPIPRERPPAKDDVLEGEAWEETGDPLVARLGDLERRLDDERAARAALEDRMYDDRAVRVAQQDQLRADLVQAKRAARRAHEEARRTRAVGRAESAPHVRNVRVGAVRGAFATIAALVTGTLWLAWMWLSAAASFDPPRLPMKGDAASEYLGDRAHAAFERPPSELWEQIANAPAAHHYVLAGLTATGLIAVLLMAIGLAGRRSRCLAWAVSLGFLAIAVDLTWLFGASRT